MDWLAEGWKYAYTEWPSPRKWVVGHHPCEMLGTSEEMDPKLANHMFFHPLRNPILRLSIVQFTKKKHTSLTGTKVDKWCKAEQSKKTAARWWHVEALCVAGRVLFFEKKKYAWLVAEWFPYNFETWFKWFNGWINSILLPILAQDWFWSFCLFHPPFRDSLWKAREFQTLPLPFPLGIKRGVCSVALTCEGWYMIHHDSS